MNIFYFKTHGDLIISLTQREIKQRYKQSILGYLWVLVTPLITMLVLNAVFSRIIRIPIPHVPYPLFIYVGLLAWNFFSNTLTAATASLVANANLITKTYFPREVLIYATVLAKLFDLLLASIVFILFMVLYQYGISIHILWVLPYLILLVLFTTGISLTFSVANLFYRDVANFLNLALLVLMYATPVMYPLFILSRKLQLYFQLNPLAQLIEGFRSAILYHQLPSLGFTLYIALISLITFLGGLFIFRRFAPSFADVV